MTDRERTVTARKDEHLTKPAAGLSGSEKMGNRITQRIHICDSCGEIPPDGEYMWHMGNQIWCEECCELNKEEPNQTHPAGDEAGKEV